MSRYLPGDIVSRRKGLVMHKGIALGDGRVLHNTPFRGEHITSEEEFRNGQRLRVERLSRRKRERALAYADNLSSARYNLLTNNCEHTVHRVSSGSSHSPQVRGWLAGAGFAAVAFALTRHPAVAAAGYALGRKVVSKWGDKGFSGR